MKTRLLVILFAAGVFLWCLPAGDNPGSEIGKLSRAVPFLERDLNFEASGIVPGMAVSYGCYRKGQAPGQKGPSRAEIKEDLEIISRYWNLIRVYNADDDTERILEVIKENDFEIKVMLGVWLEKESDNPEKQKSNLLNTVRAIKLAEQYPEQIIAINAGNETQVFWSWHRMQPENLIKYIRLIRKYTRIPVTTADDYNFWNKKESKAIARELDFIVTHIYPLWNGKTLENAISWLDSNYVQLKDFHSGKEIFLGEIGWATAYNASRRGDGEQGTLVKGKVGIPAQEEFLYILTDWIRQRQVVTFYFEVFDELWKGGGASSPEIEIEKNWGLFYSSRLPKDSFTNFIEEKLKEEQ